MARIRSIKPEILEDERTANLSDSAYRLFTSVIFLADDFGNLRGDSRWLTAQIWWSRREPPRVAPLLAELVEAELVTLYEVRGQTYMTIKKWAKHQRIDNAGKAKVPPPSEGSPILAELRREQFSEVADPPRANEATFGLAAGLDRIGEDGKGKGEEGDARGASPSALSVSPPVPKPKKLRALCTDDERAIVVRVLEKLTEQNGVAYEVGDGDTELIVAQLRKGVDEMDLRKIIAYAAAPKAQGGLGWKGNEEMHFCLRPSTLFGPKTISKYLAPARAAFASSNHKPPPASSTTLAILSGGLFGERGATP